MINRETRVKAALGFRTLAVIRCSRCGDEWPVASAGEQRTIEMELDHAERGCNGPLYPVSDAELLESVMA